MKCPKCKKDLIIPRRAYLNLESYNVGGTILVASDCCESPFLIKMKISYVTTEYTRDKTEDDWGTKFKHSTNET